MVYDGNHKMSPLSVRVQRTGRHEVSSKGGNSSNGNEMEKFPIKAFNRTFY